MFYYLNPWHIRDREYLIVVETYGLHGTTSGEIILNNWLKGAYMNTMQTDDIHLKAEIYSELINDMQAQIAEFERDYPGCMNEEIITIRHQLSEARMASRIHVDEEHFQEWESLLLSADAAMIRSKLFR